MTDRIVSFRYSRDGGRNWSTWRQRSLGATGAFLKRIELLQLGQGRQWVVQWKVTSPVRADLVAVAGKIEASDS